ncbi:Uncharacterised protein [uncultured Clostridium sp.]|uniref:hypothetical protein n=1 Tax=uncultured Clostridium sp. TaxID=59620 RepID=UPI000821D5C0|nr:hypothetical protein [uncultured Clostridium sp.]SCJ10053.1 Uncharacterised protein [uncultured Clostridium sp.]
MSNIKEIINNELTNETLRPIYLIFRDSIEVYKQLIQEEKEVFSGDYFDGFKGRLLGYVINHAFNPKFLPNNFPFNIDVVNMSFNQKRPELRKDNTVLTIAKVIESNTLPAKSKYKTEYAKGNSVFSRQLKFDLANNMEIKELPVYGIITYQIKDDELLSLNIIFPSSNYNSIEEIIPIPLISMVEPNINVDDSESILNKDSLKREVYNSLKLKSVK